MAPVGDTDKLVTNPKGVVEMDVLVDRVAGLDVHKKTVTVHGDLQSQRPRR